MRRTSPAFTMIELVFVIVIIGILAGVLIPKLSATRKDATATGAFASFQTALRQIQNDTTTKGKVVPLNTIVDSSSEISVSVTQVVASNGGTVCATATVSGTTLSVNVANSTGGCILFARIANAQTIPLLGRGISR